MKAGADRMGFKRAVRFLTPAASGTGRSVLFCLLVALIPEWLAARQVFVSPSGNDANTGQLSQPVMSLAKAVGGKHPR